jgi:hypothetical protein
MEVLFGALLALFSAGIGFWGTILAMREARGRPLMAQPTVPEPVEEALFESLMG